MARESINRCVWLVDTIRRYGRITRRQLEECWERSPLSEGKPLSRRTFYNHRDAVEELFNLRIECDPATYEYYIAHDGSGSESITNWLLNSMSLQDTLAGSHQVADRIFVEDVPSAREHLSTFIEALKENHPVRFSYHPYSRTLPTPGVEIEPYFVKLFKQRWYVIGRHVAENRIKTYALDRMRDLVTLPSAFRIPVDFEPQTYFKDAYGIVVDQSEVRKIVLKVESRQAKYFNALPLHPSQRETISDHFSLFTYFMRITDDFIEELLAHGSRITVLEPPELRARIRMELTNTLSAYQAEREEPRAERKD